jgi:hypothetical protein
MPEKEREKKKEGKREVSIIFIGKKKNNGKKKRGRVG